MSGKSCHQGCFLNVRSHQSTRLAPIADPLWRTSNFYDKKMDKTQKLIKKKTENSETRTSRSIVPINGAENSICKLISHEANFSIKSNPPACYCWTSARPIDENKKMRQNYVVKYEREENGNWQWRIYNQIKLHVVAWLETKLPKIYQITRNTTSAIRRKNFTIVHKTIVWNILQCTSKFLIMPSLPGLFIVVS